MMRIGEIMGFTSASGIICAALILGLAAFPTSAAAPTTAALELSVTGLRNTKGNVLICLTAKPKAFPDCSKDATAHKRSVPAAQAGSVRYPSVAHGVWAISLVHDENANGKLDTSMMMPKEGFGFSNNPAVVFGPPSFKKASFTVSGAAYAKGVKMKYML